jgi:hypothetical protein
MRTLLYINTHSDILYNSLYPNDRTLLMLKL